MKIKAVSMKDILEIVDDSLSEENKQPFYDMKGEELHPGDYVILARRQCSAHWLEYGKVVENAGYWTGSAFAGRYYNPYLKVNTVEKNSKELELNNASYDQQVVKIDGSAVPQNVKELLDKGVQS
jgi:hypothetical protein